MVTKPVSVVTYHEKLPLLNSNDRCCEFTKQMKYISPVAEDPWPPNYT